MKRPLPTLLFAILLAFAGLADAAELRLDGVATQGGLLVGRTAPGAQVFVDKKPVRVSNDGLFLIGFGRDAKPESVIVVRRPDGAEERHTLDVAKRKYKVQRIKGLPPKLVVPPERDLLRIRAEAELIRDMRTVDSAETFFTSGFDWPAEGRISGSYGSRRILNDEPRAPHLGLDIAAPEGTPVLAAADGKVALAYHDMLLNGSIVMIDHGHGLKSTYIHLSRIDVEKGQIVAKGERIGLVGKTGRTKGAHLHWEVSLFDTKLDPALLVAPRDARN
jgi:murein DD-endopeptidase MepM/ murein hydrolase activator NlpD